MSGTGDIQSLATLAKAVSTEIALRKLQAEIATLRQEKDSQKNAETRRPKPSRIRHRHGLEVVSLPPSQPADARARQLGNFTYHRARGLAVRHFFFGAARPHGCVKAETWTPPAL